METKEIKDKNTWEGFLLGVEEKTFLQSWNWGEFQRALGERVWRFGIYEDGNLLAVALVVKVGAKRGRFLFVPHGPLLQSSRIFNFQFSIFKQKVLKTLLDGLKKIAKEERYSFIRIASVWERSEENKKAFKDLGFREAPLHIHPELTWQLDITPSEETLLAQMRKTTRYLIKKATKEEVEILQSPVVERFALTAGQDKGDEDLEKFNQLYRDLAVRQSFVPFSFEYLKKEFLAFLPDNQIALFVGKYKGEIIAGAVIVFWQGIGFYHHGASSAKYPKVPAAYLLQWEAIKEAKKRGCRLYNFWGIADVKSERDLKNHPWSGLTLFKMGFGGYEKAYLKTQDLPLTRGYWFNYVIENVRRLKRGL